MEFQIVERLSADQATYRCRVPRSEEVLFMRQDHAEGSVQSIERALDILETLSAGKCGVGLTVIAEQLSLGPSTVHRILKTLQKRGYVNQTESSKLYRVGLKAFEVGRSFLDNLDLYSVSLPFLQDLVDKCNECAYLAAMEGRSIVTVATVDSTQTVRPHGSQRHPAHASALGKALLAGLTDAKAAEFIMETGLVPFTPYTITSYQTFRKELDDVRSQGVAFDLQECEIGLHCVSAPVKGFRGQTVAAISLAVPTQRSSDARMQELATLVKETALALSLKVGYRPTGDEAENPNRDKPMYDATVRST